MNVILKYFFIERVITEGISVLRSQLTARISHMIVVTPNNTNNTIDPSVHGPPLPPRP